MGMPSEIRRPPAPYGYLREVNQQDILREERRLLKVKARYERRKMERIHYYVRVGVCTLLCALLLLVGVPVFMAGRQTGSLSYTALGVMLSGFGILLAVAVLVQLFKPPFEKS